MGRSTEALALAQTALTGHDKVLGQDHAWTRASARVTSDALQITNWLRARTASEAFKREAYKYAASVTPYDDPLKRDAALNSERERIERDVDDLLASAVSSTKAGSAPRDKLSKDEYVAGRVRGQIDRFYLPKATTNKKIAVSLRWGPKICSRPPRATWPAGLRARPNRGAAWLADVRRAAGRGGLCAALRGSQAPGLCAARLGFVLLAA
jgi:hypothetical protein